jgi:hypothetical protein
MELFIFEMCNLLVEGIKQVLKYVSYLNLLLVLIASISLTLSLKENSTTPL